MGGARKSDLCATALEAGAGCKDAERRVAVHTELPPNWLHSVKPTLHGGFYFLSFFACIAANIAAESILVFEAALAGRLAAAAGCAYRM